ncbi:hypothetical protein [Papillibacter cinnamivorans]|uniref:Uncharacterized protein n=1 Tax=Papillibacter cinnamivorans DSM 12816 TaxID=1122930 RepID=A0A1W2BF88_9FIRM|nr:hypothetical protein [Papillibacter cinnamivorans]SMC71511.1 hypothetical protein SAMN02745168_2153 [Papillibacter cinnamivorans DSM 12816]
MNPNQLTYSNSVPDDIDFNISAALAAAPAEDSPVAAVFGAAFDAISNPDYPYLAVTSKISLDAVADYSYIGSVTDGFQTVTFSTNMEKVPPDGINNWGVPPYTEDPNKPATLYSGYSATTTTWTLSRPARTFGIELMPNAFGTWTYEVDFYTGDLLVGSITRTIIVPGPPLGPSSQGARLFAAFTNDIGFDRIVIKSLSGNTLGFLVGQIRYQSCVKLCNAVIGDTAEKGATVPVTCCVSVPGFEVISVSNDIKATILSTCCEVQEGVVCPVIGPVAGIKTASAKIFAQLQIPVTLRSGGGGCLPIVIPYTCTTSAVFTIENVFISGEIKNCRVIGVTDVAGTDFHVVPPKPDTPNCCIAGNVSLSAKVSACVMTNCIEVSKC